MILKGSQRSGSGQLATHLQNTLDNDHVTLHELRGFVSTDLDGAFAEMHAISKATQCRQFMFSLSLNPPKEGSCGLEAMIEAADRAEVALGLENQPRAIVVHEKEGRRHIHAVWSRIDIAEMKAVPMPFYKNRLASLSKELYLEHGWELPEGHRENGWKNPLNFTLGEWQQAKRLDLDPREISMAFADAWKHSDGPMSFKAALEDRGYFLARGDRRGFVAVDVHGEVYAVARKLGLKTRDMEARLGSPDGLPDVAEVRLKIGGQMRSHLQERLKDIRTQHQDELKPFVEARTELLSTQRAERERLGLGQEQRLKRETADRQQRTRKGVMGVFDILTGRAAVIRQQNEREAFEGYRRDLSQREALFTEHLKEREGLQLALEELRREQRKELVLTIRNVVRLLRNEERHRQHHGGRELTLQP